jgi:ATP-dependent Zn protease
MSGPISLDYASKPPASRSGRKLLGWLIFVGVALMVFALLRQSNSQHTTISLSDFYAQMTSGNVAKVVIDEDRIEGDFKSPARLSGTAVLNFRTYIPPGSAGTMTQLLLQATPPIVVHVEPPNSVLNNFVLPIIPWILILGFIWFFVFRNLRRWGAQGSPVPPAIVNPEAR